MNDSPALTIEYASGSKGLLQGLLSESKNVCLDLAAINAVDLSGVQLLVAMLREAAAQKKEVHFSGTLSASFRDLISIAGVTHGECLTGEDLESALKAVF
jgi:ABC-type transporter Mla MlaB component